MTDEREKEEEEEDSEESEFKSVFVPFSPFYAAAPRKYGYAGSFSKLFRAQKRGGGGKHAGGRGKSLNFYSCADETAIFRSIK